MAKKNSYSDTPETLLAAILAMQDKILEKLPEFEAADLDYTAEMADGREIIRANPLVQEYRALVKDFSQALKAYKEITGAADHEATKKLDDLRSKFKVAT